MKIKLVGAYCTVNRAMGLKGKLPWHYTSDLALFKQEVKNCVLVCGHLTAKEVAFLKLPMFVVSHKAPFAATMNSALIHAAKNHMEVAIIGGAKVFELGMAWADELVITEISKRYDGDVFFPEIDEEKFTCVYEAFDEDEPDLTFKIYKRVGEEK